MQTYPVKRNSSSDNHVSKPDYDHAADFDFNQKNGINSNEINPSETQAQKAAELFAKEQAGEISPEELQKQLVALADGDDVQKQLVEKMADELMEDIQKKSQNTQERLTSLIENALSAIKTGDDSNLDPRLLFLAKAKTENQNPLLMNSDQDDQDPNANFVSLGSGLGGSNGLGDSFKASADDSTPAPSFLGSKFSGGLGGIDLNSTNVIFVIMALFASVAAKYQDSAILKTRMATANKKLTDELQAVGDALQDLHEVLSSLNATSTPPLDPTKPGSSVDLQTLLQNRGPELTHLVSWLKNHGDLKDPLSANNDQLAGALQQARDSANGASTSLGNTGDLIPSSDLSTATFTNGSITFLTSTVQTASTQVTSGTSANQQLTTETQALLQEYAGAMTAQISMLDIFKAISSKMWQ